MNNIIKIIPVLIICLLLCGCRKITNIDYKLVEVEVVSVEHEDRKIIPVYNGKTFTYIISPEKFYTRVKYNNIIYDFNDLKTYEFCKNKVNQKVSGKLQITEYDDGRTTSWIVGIEVKEE